MGRPELLGSPPVFTLVGRVARAHDVPGFAPDLFALHHCDAVCLRVCFVRVCVFRVGAAVRSQA